MHATVDERYRGFIPLPASCFLDVAKHGIRCPQKGFRVRDLLVGHGCNAEAYGNRNHPPLVAHRLILEMLLKAFEKLGLGVTHCIVNCESSEAQIVCQ